MNCDIVKDLIPLYIDRCCSEESKNAVEEHIRDCDDCKKLYEDMISPAEPADAYKAPAKLAKLNEWKASIMQSILILVSFALITIGVAFEAQTPLGLMNGFWALNIVIPATGFMLSLTTWYFVRLYKSRRDFSNYSLAATVGITLCAYIWAIFHYEIDLASLFSIFNFEVLYSIFVLNSPAIILTVVFCALSKILSNQYAKMLGKE